MLFNRKPLAFRRAPLTRSQAVPSFPSKNPQRAKWLIHPRDLQQQRRSFQTQNLDLCHDGSVFGWCDEWMVGMGVFRGGKIEQFVFPFFSPWLKLRLNKNSVILRPTKGGDALEKLHNLYILGTLLDEPKVDGREYQTSLQKKGCNNV